MASSAASSAFPWRQLGQLLVDEGLLTDVELELALDEQRRSGRMLGQIVVDRGYLTAFSLARVLSAQHGLDLRTRDDQEPESTLAEVPSSWRPLGRVLVENGLITQQDLGKALVLQGGNRRLGEILVERRLISGEQLARALSEQHGVALNGDVQATLKDGPGNGAVYRVYRLSTLRGSQQREKMCEYANFLEAADFAMDYVQEQEPEALEIERIEAEQQETVWSYSESRAAAAEVARKDLVDTFGFDPLRWNPNRF
jgi:hypothetical protein